MLRIALFVTIAAASAMGAPNRSGLDGAAKPVDLKSVPLSKAELPIPPEEVEAARSRLPKDLTLWREKLKPRRVTRENGGGFDERLGLLYTHSYAKKLADKLPHKYVPFKRLVADFKVDAHVVDDDMSVVRDWRIVQSRTPPSGGPRGAIDLRLGTHSHVTPEGLKLLDTHPTQLACLYLSDVATLSDDDLTSIGPLLWLQILDVKGCPNISGSFLKNFKPLPRLRVLGLTNTPVTDEMLEPLSQCRNLKFLRLHATQVSPEGVEQLLAKLSEAGLDTVVDYLQTLD